MRISGGRARGIPLRVNKKSGVRPATETIRERLFSSISQRIDHASILDLFAGSGAYGLEALSRGAQQTTLVEKNRLVFSDLSSNLASVQKSANLPADSGRLVKRDVLDFLQDKATEPYDLIFVDPPYAELPRLCPRVLRLLYTNEYLSTGGLLVIECPGDFFPESSDWKIHRTIGKEKRGTPVHRILIKES
jgi:16S rRNA (guanine966-N2)-methyltransferase